MPLEKVTAALAWLRGGAFASVWLALVDAVVLRPPAAVTLLGAALALGWLALCSLVAMPLCATRRGMNLLEALARRPLLRATLGLLLCGAAAALLVANGRVYVRLYLFLHLVVSAGALLVAQLGFLCAFPVARASRVLTLGGAALWIVLLVGSLAHVLGSPALRAAALDRSTLAAHGLLTLHELWGVLDDDGDDDGERAAAAAGPTPAPTPVRGALAGKNLLLVTVDSMRADEVPSGGALARLQREALTFTRAYAPSCWTIHSMAAVLTSRLPSQLRYTYASVDTSLRMTPRAATDELVTNPVHARKVTPVPWDETTPTLAELLSADGYQTATPIAYVFYRREAGVTRGFELVDERPWREHNVDNLGVTSPALTDAALAFLRARDPARPFFLWVHYMDPHAPYVDQEGGGGDARARYRSELRFVDRHLARLLEAVPEDETLVVVHADHGEEFREHGGQYHATTLYEEVARVPLFLRLPGRPPARVDTPVSLLDLAPTIVDLLGIPGGVFVGRSLAAPAGPRPVFAECRRFGRDRRLVLEGHHKLIVDRATGARELYDLAADPAERRNLVEERPEVAARLGELEATLP